MPRVSGRRPREGSVFPPATDFPVRPSSHCPHQTPPSDLGQQALSSPILTRTRRRSSCRLESTEKAFWDHPGCHAALAVSGLYTIATFTLLSHDVALGSFWCPLNACGELDNSTTHHVLHMQRVILSVISLLLDVFVIFFHTTEPVHPKFVLHWRRRIIMRLHISSGALQCIAGPVLYGLIDAGQQYHHIVRAGIYALAVWGMLVHTPTVLFLLMSSFGAVRITMPGFLHATGMYVYTLLRLVSSPDARLKEDFLSYWLVLHVYAFNRLVFVILTKYNILADARYTISILLGLAIAVPPALGCNSILLVVGAIVVFNAAFRRLMDKSLDASRGELYSAGGLSTKALVKSHFNAPEGCCLAPSLRALSTHKPHTREELARVVFSGLDADKSGKLNLREVGHLLMSWGLPVHETQEVLDEKDSNGDGEIDFNEFFQNFAPVWEFAARIVLSNEALPGEETPPTPCMVASAWVHRR